MIHEVLADRQINPVRLVDHGLAVERRVLDDVELVFGADSTW
jgi:hypothetical protein